ncbi:hypothetical protein [Arthrobacter sp. 260]|uniref:ATP-grasp domain-containing protein n=1 Tax=Arthrobacter sp. 260 TaxID=2735314 RepID=UPI001492B35D|nr:hypothetical protein [Arthrobacter sp. 260]NOJ59196.1 hypothetical protein [Arthrobacter sp. 260]
MLDHRQGQRSVAFLLGKPPRAGTLLPEVMALLNAADVDTAVHLPHDQPELPDWVAGAHLVVHRGLKWSALRSVAQLAEARVPCCNPPAAVALTRKRPALMALLSQAGLPVPLTVAVSDWQEARAAATTLSVIKTAEGGDGRGENVLAGTRGDLPGAPPFPGPYVVQPFIANDGWDRKLYVAGARVRSLLKPSPLAHGHVTGGAPIAVDDALSRLAGRVADVTGLEIFGVDFLMGEAGPVIVDVNPFPGFRGVGEGPAMITEHLLARLD